MYRIDVILKHPLFQEAFNHINEKEKDRIFCRHGMQHSMDVARIAYILALENKLDIDKDVIYACALCHDLGRSAEYDSGTPHHHASMKLAEPILRDAGYSDEELALMLDAIGRHRNTSENGSMDLAEILYRADKKSRLCFECQATNECYWPDDKRTHTVEI